MTDAEFVDRVKAGPGRRGARNRQSGARAGSSSPSARTTSSPSVTTPPGRAWGSSTSRRSAAWTWARASRSCTISPIPGTQLNLATQVPKANPPHRLHLPRSSRARSSTSASSRTCSGSIVDGIPDPRPLVLPDDWPAGNYPLCKAWKLVRPEEDHPRRKIMKFTIPIGPQHPALKEPISLRMTIEGEVIRDADIRLGYNHRGLEKLAEEKTWTPEHLPDRAHLRHLLPLPRHLLHPGRREAHGDRAAAPGPLPPATWSPSSSASTATSSGWASPATRPGSTPSSCTPGATGKSSWTSWR